MAISLNSESTESITTQLTQLNGRSVIVSNLSYGPTSALSAQDGQALAKAVVNAKDKRIPFIAILSTSGDEPSVGSETGFTWAEVAKELANASGIIPIIFGVSGPVVSGVALLLGLSDINIFTTSAYAFISGPKIVETFTGSIFDIDSLGGPSVHESTTGVATVVVENTDEILETAEEFLSYMPDSVDELPRTLETQDPTNRQTPEAGELVPTSATGSYDVRDVINSIVDDENFLELKAFWAPNLVTGFARFGGLPVGIVANQTQALAGSIDIPASQKGAQFVSMCDAFNIPLLTLVDTSGFLPGKDLEWRGMIRHGAQMAFAYARATVPRIGLILRKSYGGAYIVMDSRYMGNDLMLAWPTAEVAVMGAKGAVKILHRKASEEEQVELVKDYEAKYLNPYSAAERGSISAVIDPAETRSEISAAFELLNTKREKLRPRKHDNSPL